MLLNGIQPNESHISCSYCAFEWSSLSCFISLSCLPHSTDLCIVWSSYEVRAPGDSPHFVISYRLCCLVRWAQLLSTCPLLDLIVPWTNRHVLLGSKLKYKLTLLLECKAFAPVSVKWFDQSISWEQLIEVHKRNHLIYLEMTQKEPYLIEKVHIA